MGISIALADDHPILRAGMKSLLEAESEFSVIAEAGDGLEALRVVEKHQADVLLLDIAMPALNGLDAIPAIRQRAPRTRIVVLSMHLNEAFVSEALKRGAMAYVLKCCKSIHLLEAIREVMEGRRYLSPPLSENAVEAYVRKLQAHPLDLHDTLTPRERQVLQLSAEGNTSPVIAKRLHLSPRTVEMHRRNLMRKIGLKNQAELIQYAIRRGILPQ